MSNFSGVPGSQSLYANAWWANARFSVLLLLAVAFGTVVQSAAGQVAGGADPLSGRCDPKQTVVRFNIDFSGNVSDSGRTYEGPVCVEVFYNPVQQFAGLQTATTTTAGPDLSKVALGGAAAGAAVALKPLKLTATQDNLLAEIAGIESGEVKVNAALNAVSQSYAKVLQAQNKAIDELSAMRAATSTLAGGDVERGVKNGYAALQGDLATAVLAKSDFSPTDVTDKLANVCLSLAQKLEDKLARLPLEFPGGALTTFKCEDKSGAVSWGNYIAQCKDSIYTPLKGVIDTDLQTATTYASASDNVTALKKKVAIVGFWNFLFTVRGLTPDMDDDGIKKASVGGFYLHQNIPCGALFNQTSSTVVNLVTGDLGPTLTGDAPTIKSQTAFATVTCSTPFAVSAGAGFDLIEQKQFAIIKSSDGEGGTVDTFGTTGDSKITPVALGVIHVRLKDYAHHELGVYGSLGVGGSLQNQTDANPVRFLPGISVSLWRTMYVTAGAMIGRSTELAGGYKVGDKVPTGITAIDGLTSTSYKTGFGFAITFTKP